MTIKEFVRRCNSFASLDSAAGCFSYPLVQSVFRLSITYIDGTTHVTYVSFVALFDFDSDYCNSIWFDRFTRSDFLIQLKFFKCFISKLSKYQLDIIKSDKRFSNLFKFLSNERKV